MKLLHEWLNEYAGFITNHQELEKACLYRNSRLIA